MSTSASQPDTICSRRTCPAFTYRTIEGVEGVQFRTYTQDMTWVVTKRNGIPDIVQSRTMFRRLRSYIRDVGINMTAPVLQKIKTITTTNPPSYETTMMFYVPMSNPPTPVAPRVSLETMTGPRSFVVKAYNKTALNDPYQATLQGLEAAVNNVPFVSVIPNLKYKAGYQSPSVPIRYSEVMLEVSTTA